MGAPVVALVKPQFEAGRDDVGKGGVVRDDKVHRRVLVEIAALAQRLGLGVAGLIVSPLVGPAGNVEFLVYLRPKPGGADVQKVAPEGLIEQALAAAEGLRRERR